VIKRIEGQLLRKSLLAKSVLSWIIYIERPLITGELYYILVVELSEDELDFNNILDIKDLVLAYTSLVSVD